MGAMLALSALGVNIGPLLAGAGVVGLAIGFGAQKLVQDIITGAFLQFENVMNTGDVVTAGGITGKVDKLTIRSVSLRTADGTYHLIPFSSVDAVANLTKGFAYHVIEIGIAYREDVDEAKRLMDAGLRRTARDRARRGDHRPVRHAGRHRLRRFRGEAGRPHHDPCRGSSGTSDAPTARS